MADIREGTSEKAWRELSFTAQAEESFYAVVDSPDFFRQDAKLIYQALRDQLRPVSFGDYLKRYIYRKAEIGQPFGDVPPEEYQDIIVESFLNRGVPASFECSTLRLRAASRNWLTQRCVSREVVLLLGFGLRMTVQDVEELLTKGLQEPRLNPGDPREAICAYCYSRGYGYHRYKSLMDRCREGNSGPEEGTDSPEESELLRRVTELMAGRMGPSGREEARRQFGELYEQARQVTAEILGAEGTGEARSPENITPSDIEQVLQAAIPRDRYGNLMPMKKSTLHKQFRGSRLSRQRIEKLTGGTAGVNRYDLLTLHFFVYSQRGPEDVPKLQYYRQFVEQANSMLARCGMGPIYTANPYECFLLMCVLSEDPLGTYADVIEQSYMEDET